MFDQQKKSQLFHLRVDLADSAIARRVNKINEMLARTGGGQRYANKHFVSTVNQTLYHIKEVLSDLIYLRSHIES